MHDIGISIVDQVQYIIKVHSETKINVLFELSALKLAKKNKFGKNGHFDCRSVYSIKKNRICNATFMTCPFYLIV